MRLPCSFWLDDAIPIGQFERATWSPRNAYAGGSFVWPPRLALPHSRVPTLAGSSDKRSGLSYRSGEGRLVRFGGGTEATG